MVMRIYTAPRTRPARVVASPPTMRTFAAGVRASMALCVLGFVGCGGASKAPPAAAGGQGGGGGADGMPLGGNAGTSSGGAAGYAGSAGGGSDDASARNVMAEATIDARPPFACDGGKCSPIVVGGFDAARGGDYSFELGHFSQARDALLATFPGSRLVSFSQLTAAGLAGIDVSRDLFGHRGRRSLRAALVRRANGARCGLSLKGGGCYVALPDNDTFGGSDTPVANASLISPFGTTTRWADERPHSGNSFAHCGNSSRGHRTLRRRAHVLADISRGFHQRRRGGHRPRHQSARPRARRHESRFRFGRRRLGRHVQRRELIQ